MGTDQKTRIVYHHIPKCAGMSVAAGIGLSYFPLHVLRHGKKFPGHLNARAASETADTAQTDRYVFRRQMLEYYIRSDKTPYVFGHYPFSHSVYEECKQRWSFVTVLRDPESRWYSEYFWNRYKDHDYAKTDLDMEDYLDSPQGRRDTRSFVNFMTQAEDPEQAVSDKELKAALSALECFDVIGILENLPKFQEDMKTVFGRGLFIPKRNKSPAPEGALKRPEKGSAFDKKLKKALAADIEIYNAALKKLKL